MRRLLRARLEATLGASATGTISRSDAVADIVARQAFFLAEWSLALSLSGIATIATRAIAAGTISRVAAAARTFATETIASVAVAARTLATETISSVAIAAGALATETISTVAVAASAIAAEAISAIAIACAFATLARSARRTIATRGPGALVAGEPGARRWLIHTDLSLRRRRAASATLLRAGAGLRAGIAAGSRGAASTLALAARLAPFRARPERAVVADAIERAQLARFIGESAAPGLL